MSRPALIYVGRCLPTNKVYVGSSIRGKRRVFSHIMDLNKFRHSNSYLQNAWNKYGEKAFVWYVVEVCNPAELIEREQWWIDLLRATDERYGFNLLYPVTGKKPRVKSRLALVQIEKWRDPVVREQRLTSLREVHKNPEWRARRAQSMTAKWADPEWRDKMLKVLSANVKRLQFRMANEPGFKEHRMRGIQPVKTAT